jgi:hypothetical protein
MGRNRQRIRDVGAVSVADSNARRRSSTLATRSTRTRPSSADGNARREVSVLLTPLGRDVGAIGSDLT